MSLPGLRRSLASLEEAHLSAAVALEAELVACEAVLRAKGKEAEDKRRHTPPPGWRVPDLWWVSGKPPVDLSMAFRDPNGDD